MDFGARYGSFLAAVSSTIVALAYGTSVMVSLKKDQENMRALHSKDLENMRALTEEKIKAAKAEAANQAINDYLKYNHSEEYKSLRKSTEKSDSQ
jgi:hypothetical protein